MDEKRIKELEMKVFKLQVDNVLNEQALFDALRDLVNHRAKQLVINYCFLAYILYNIFFR